MDKLLCYTLSHPEKLDRIGKYLLDILSDSIYRNQSGWVKVMIDFMIINHNFEKLEIKISKTFNLNRFFCLGVNRCDC